MSPSLGPNPAANPNATGTRMRAVKAESLPVMSRRMKVPTMAKPSVTST
jgi:hypothetical protein